MANQNYIPSKTLIIEDGKIYGRPDFAGARFGTRQFSVFLDTVESKFTYENHAVKPEDLPEILTNDGWVIGWTKTEEPRPFLNVKVKYRNKNGELFPRKRQPRVTVRNIARKTERTYTEDTVDIVDDLSIDKISVFISSNPYQDRQTGNTLYSAWAREICAYAKPRYYFDEDPEYTNEDEE